MGLSTCLRSQLLIYRLPPKDTLLGDAPAVGDRVSSHLILGSCFIPPKDLRESMQCLRRMGTELSHSLLDGGVG